MYRDQKLATLTWNLLFDQHLTLLYSLSMFNKQTHDLRIANAVCIPQVLQTQE